MREFCWLDRRIFITKTRPNGWTDLDERTRDIIKIRNNTYAIFLVTLYLSRGVIVDLYTAKATEYNHIQIKYRSPTKSTRFINYQLTSENKIDNSVARPFEVDIGNLSGFKITEDKTSSNTMVDT